jgi:hypothetical protein
MKLVKSLFVGVLMLTATSAMALDAKEVGNGGNAVLCPATKSAELLDYYEARILRNMNVTMGSGKDPVAVAQFAVQRLKKLSPLRALAYEKYIQSFISESRFLKGVELVEINDSGHIFLPTNCKPVQVAVQKAPAFPGDGRYVINQDVWDQMPVTSQAGLILHEVIYREALEFGASDSRAVRYLNSVLAADQLANYNPISFAKMMVEIGFPAYESYGTFIVSNGTLNTILDQSEFFRFVRPAQVKIQDYLFDTRIPGSIERYSSGNESKVTGYFIYRYQAKDLTLTNLEFYDKPGSYKQIQGKIIGGVIEFGFIGATYKFYDLTGNQGYVFQFDQDDRLKAIYGTLEIGRGNFKTPGVFTTLYMTELSDYGFPNDRAFLHFAAETKVKTDQGELLFKGNSESNIELHPQGSLKKGTLIGLQSFNGGVTCEEGLKVELDENGSIDMHFLIQDSIRGCWKNKF